MLLSRSAVIAALLAAAAYVPAFAQQTSPTLVPPAQPIPAAPTTPTPAPVVLDTANDHVGIAQTTAQAKGLQARIIWMDAGANVGNLNSLDKIESIVKTVKDSGFNMIVLDVKPIVGDTIYPSIYAPKLTAWKGQTVNSNFDVLRAMLLAAHAVGLTVYANMSTFGEGHKYVKRGLAYTHPDWQTTLYQVNRGVFSSNSYAAISKVDGLPANDDSLGALTDSSLLTKDLPGYTVAVLNFDARVVGIYDGAALARQNITIPLRGSALIGTGRAGQWLQTSVQPNEILRFIAQPDYLPIAYVPEQAITMFCDPINPEVRQHELDIVREIVTNYDVDGIVFDDRLRYAAVNADFGPRSRAAFEQFLGHPITWPDDVFRTSPYPGQEPIYGPCYQQWLNWRAGNIQSWVAEAAEIVRAVRPGAQVAVYAGSWYGDYDKVASNYAAPDFQAPYQWDTPDYQKTGYGNLLDWITTGCYYGIPTVADARTQNFSPGATVEAAGQLSNRVMNDAAWTYAGLAADNYARRPDEFQRAIQAATASTQGVMIFDMSQIINWNWWPVIAQAFGTAPPPQAPNTVRGLLDDVRKQHEAKRAAGLPPPPVPPYLGIENTGF